MGKLYSRLICSEDLVHMDDIQYALGLEAGFEQGDTMFSMQAASRHEFWHNMYECAWVLCVFLGEKLTGSLIGTTFIGFTLGLS